MSSANSYAAQGATLKLGPATAAAKTITAATKANPVKLTCTAHGLAEGTPVVLSAFVGMTELNGKAGIVRVVDANSFEVPGIDSTAFGTYSSGGSATPTQVQVGNFISWSGLNGQASVIDCTDLDSTAKESKPGLMDNGTFDIQVQVNDTDTGQQVLRSSLAGAGPTTTFLLTFKNGKTRSFTAYCTSAPEQGGVDTIITGSFSSKISGSVTRG